MKNYSVPAGIMACGIFCGFITSAQAAVLQTNQNPMNIGLSALFAAGGANAGDTTIAELQTGGHDPKHIGFNLQNLELSLGGAVDPFFDAQANIVLLLDEDGESMLEIEEAYLLSKRLPASLQLKAGQFYTEFGRHNSTHPHTWAFIDQPIILGRTLGEDGLRSQGARVSWLSPLPWYAEFILGLQNARGASGDAFLGGGHSHNDQTTDEVETDFTRSINGPEDFIYSFRWLNGADLNDTISANLGVSMLVGPNPESDDARTIVQGLDLYAKWQPMQTQRGFPFVAWHTEMVMRHYELAEDGHDDHNHAEDHSSVRDQGWFSQLSYGFKPGWVTGIRLEKAWSNSDLNDATTSDRFRAALNLTWLPTEYSKIRLQYNLDQADQLDKDVHSLWLQFEYNLGSHAAHVF